MLTVTDVSGVDRGKTSFPKQSPIFAGIAVEGANGKKIPTYAGLELTEKKLKEIGIDSEIAKVQSAIVRIRPCYDFGDASGVVISPNGYILTCNHVIEVLGTKNLLADFPLLEDSNLPVKITPDDIDKGINRPALHRKIKVFPVPLRVVARSPHDDLALLGITLPEPEDPWPFVRLGGCSIPEIGDYVFEIGHADGTRHNVIHSGQLIHTCDDCKKVTSSNKSIKGYSGGLLATKDGEALGIICGSKKKSRVIAGKILAFFKRQRYMGVDFPVKTVSRSVRIDRAIQFLERLTISVNDVIDGKPLRFSDEIEKIFDATLKLNNQFFS